MSRANKLAVSRDLHGNHVGWMHKYKLGTRFKQGWKRRYFVLTDTHLNYYTNPMVCTITH
jgi:hypothetical protein